MAETPKALRCAVYTRKSSEEGLEQAFNSLHAQREACEAYIKSQQHEGWTLVPTDFDDGAYSGGNMERPALRALLGEVKAGNIDVIVVYKVDRLTRSLPDFARIVDVLDQAKASFVSVTQAFNTTSSMGRLTLNVLLSFAQFEREVTGERIRDKIAASKAKGMWMGGPTPLGYEVVGRALAINPAEAKIVRSIFQLFLKLKSVDKVKVETDRMNLRTKVRRYAGAVVGDQPFSRGTLYHLLENRLYVGEVVHRKNRFPGQHPAIVDLETFEAAQAAIVLNRRTRKSLSNSPHPSLLAGLLRDKDGTAFTSTHTQKGARRYRYYALAAGTETDASMRLPAEQVERLVIAELTRFLKAPDRLLAAFQPGDAHGAEAVFVRAAEWISRFNQTDSHQVRDAALSMFDRVVWSSDTLELHVRGEAFGSPSVQTFGWAHPAHIVRRGVGIRLVVDNGHAEIDASLVRILSTGAAWFDDLVEGRAKSLSDLARRNNCTVGYVARLVETSFLCPGIKTAVVQGRQPVQLTSTRLLSKGPLPLFWEDHEAFVLGDG